MTPCPLSTYAVSKVAGEQSRDFVAVENVVEANLRAASAAGDAGRVFNVGSGRAVTVNALLATMADLMGVESEAVHEPSRPGEIRHSRADATAARPALGFEVRVPLEAGLAQILAMEETPSSAAS